MIFISEASMALPRWTPRTRRRIGNVLVVRPGKDLAQEPRSGSRTYGRTRPFGQDDIHRSVREAACGTASWTASRHRWIAVPAGDAGEASPPGKSNGLISGRACARKGRCWPRRPLGFETYPETQPPTRRMKPLPVRTADDAAPRSAPSTRPPAQCNPPPPKFKPSRRSNGCRSVDNLRPSVHRGSSSR